MKDYHINVFYSEDDEGYIADIPDLQHCSAFGATPEEAQPSAAAAAEIIRRSNMAVVLLRVLRRQRANVFHARRSSEVITCSRLRGHSVTACAGPTASPERLHRASSPLNPHRLARKPLDRQA